ncbi:MAG: Efflux ABC transporter, ATP-binding protein [Cytophagales bacterium]|jgi:ABC-2 type transport system ATP-binding protein|nr:ABC transporter ATP-binding protein [Bacteroidota bacterium]MBS1981379.1 ABC transporter ATP-binding protein [Bacteroidota bacterium]WHZ06807.1 MAG: Efflux ABC transporter, ATP-binding protein [Cytophagales bacterium]
MTSYCLQTQHLTHYYSTSEKVLNQINLQVPRGSIYGYLGPNGAGKTTTLRLVLGLLRVQEGEVFIFDKPFNQHRLELLKSIGSMIESPSLYGHLTAYENLDLLQRIYKCPKARIAEVLSLVGLANTGSKKASQFSLGMRQRLGIAIALLHNPSFLILDEPTNGLDPNGMIEVRELLKKLNREQRITILISSHLLSEIEKMVTHVGIVHKGSMLFQSTLEELKTRQLQSSSIELETSNAEAAVQIAKEFNIHPEIRHEKIVLPVVSKKIVARLNQQLVQQGIDVYAINIVKNDLETIFMDVINN